MAWIPFDKYLESLLGKTGSPTPIDHDVPGGNGFKVAICTASYTPNRAAHDYFNDLTNEVTGTNYSAGGVALANPTLTTSSNAVKFDADDPSSIAQHASGFANGRILVLYLDTGNAATSTLIAYHDAGSDFGNVAGAVQIQLASGGIASLGSA